jgi:hypothetical protein
MLLTAQEDRKIAEHERAQKVHLAEVTARTEKDQVAIRQIKDLQARIDEIYDISFGLVKKAISQDSPRDAAYCLTNAVKVTELMAKDKPQDNQMRGSNAILAYVESEKAKE